MRTPQTTATTSRLLIFTVNSHQKIWGTRDRCFGFDALQHKTFTCSHITVQTQLSDLLTLQGVRNQTAGDTRETLVFWKGAVFTN